MMAHSQYRSAVLADPNDPNPELRAHVGNCAACRAFTDKLTGFESKLARALRIDVAPTAAAEVVSLASRRKPAAGTRWMAVAASALFGAVLVGTVWLGFATPSLASAVVAHMTDEPGAWHTEAAVSAPKLNAVLQSANVKLMPAAGTVSYANSCAFRGYVVPHLVVQTDSGPVTVMVLIHETRAKAKQFDEQGYRGVIVPVQGHGALAVLMKDSHTDAAAVDKIARQVRESIVWTR